jgi:hypothetical protein
MADDVGPVVSKGFVRLFLKFCAVRFQMTFDIFVTFEVKHFLFRSDGDADRVS